MHSRRPGGKGPSPGAAGGMSSNTGASGAAPAGSGGGAGGLVHTSSIRPRPGYPAEERGGDHHQHHRPAAGGGSASVSAAAPHHQSYSDHAVHDSFDVLEMDLSAMGQSTTVTQTVTRERRLDIMSGVVVLRASVKGSAPAQQQGPDGNIVMVPTVQSGPVVRGVASTEEPRFVLYLDTGWYQLLDHSGSNTLMLLLPRRHLNRAFVTAVQRQLDVKLALSPRMSTDVQLPLGVSFPTHYVHITEDGQVRDSATYADEQQQLDGGEAGGGGGKGGGGGGDGSGNATVGGKEGGGGGGGGKGEVVAGADLSIIRDLELRRLLESTGAVAQGDVDVLLNFGVTSLAPAIVETANALLLSTQSSNPSGRAITKLAETIGSSLTTHEIQGRMHLAVPVLRAAVTSFAALLQLARHQPNICSNTGAGEAIVDSIERCASALLVGSFETCLGLQDQSQLRQELAVHIAGALSMLQQMISHRHDGSNSTRNSASSAAAAAAAATDAAAEGNRSPQRNQEHRHSRQFRFLVAPLLSRALVFFLAMVAPLPTVHRQVMDALADSHGSQILFATHSTMNVFGTTAASGGAKDGSGGPRLVDSHVALAACAVLSNLSSESINAWANQMISVASSGFGLKRRQKTTSRGGFSFADGGASNDACNNSSTATGSGSAHSGQVVSRAGTTALSLATQLLESAISERALAAISSRSMVNRESAASAATALLTSRAWTDGSRAAALSVFQLHVRLCESVLFMSCFSGTAAHESLCWHQSLIALGTPLRRMASWFGTLFPPDVAAAAGGGAEASIIDGAGADAGSGGGAGASSSSTMHKAVRECMTRAACRYLTTRAAVDGLNDTSDSAFFDSSSSAATAGGSHTASSSSSAGYNMRAASAASSSAGPSSSWLVRCVVLCGTGAIRTEIIGSCAVMVRLQVLSSAVLLADASGTSATPSFLGIPSASTPPAQFGRTPLGNRRMMMNSFGAVMEVSSDGGGGAGSTPTTPNSSAAGINKNKSRRVELFRRCERMWGKLMTQLTATVSACPEPSTAHSVWSTAALIAHRFSQSATIILQRGGTDSLALRRKTDAVGASGLVGVAAGVNPAADARAAGAAMSNAALMCSSLILSVPQTETLTTFSGGSSLLGDGSLSGGAFAPPDAGAYLSSDAWDGLAEFENHCVFSVSEREAAASGGGGAAGGNDFNHSSVFFDETASGGGGSQIDLTPSVQEEAFWYIDRSCEDENESARLMTVSRRRLQAVQDARESAAAPPSRCAWFAARAIKDYSRANFRAQQDMFEDTDTMALLCSELASLFFFGSGVHHASSALLPVLACLRQTGDRVHGMEYDSSGRAVNAATAGRGADAADGINLKPRIQHNNNNEARALFDAQLAMTKQQQQQQRQQQQRFSDPTSFRAASGQRNFQQQQQQQQPINTPTAAIGRRTPLKRESVLTETLRSQRMLNPSSDVM